MSRIVITPIQSAMQKNIKNRDWLHRRCVTPTQDNHLTEFSSYGLNEHLK